MPSPAYLASRAYVRARILSARVRRVPAGWSGLRILCYHSVADVRHDLAVRPAAFHRQMAMVAASGATPIRLADAMALPAPLERRFVAVTFDDGYQDNVAAAEAVLAALGIPATVYLPTGIIDAGAGYDWFRPPPEPLDWQACRAAIDRGTLDFQSHTRTHRLLPDLDAAAADEEIAGSKRDLEDRLGRPVTSFAYPAGQYAQRDVRLVAGAGYAAAVTTRPGTTHAPGGSFELPRTCVYGADDDDVFAARLTGALDRPSPIQEALHRRRSRSRVAG
jgi:peptidoglycan/xylan/chitin deacetylase (PgdA/CDA1 family)